MPELESIKNSNVTIAYLESDFNKTAKGKKILGLTELVTSKNKWAIDYDFTITIYTENIKELTDDQLAILVYHELLHVGVDGDKYSVKPHDLEDFKVIIDKYGAYWDTVNI